MYECMCVCVCVCVPFYLLLKVSSDIIKRCCHKIVLDDLFEGRVEKSKEALEVRKTTNHTHLKFIIHTIMMKL